MTRPAALFTQHGRERLARMLVWGARPKMLNRDQIEQRIKFALERMAKALDGQQSEKRI